MRILSDQKIRQKIKRLAIEILERNTEESALIVAGINNNGLLFASLIVDELKKICDSPIHLTRIRLNPATPIDAEVTIDMDVDKINGRAILIVDDVANTGRTLFYACKPLLNIIPKKIEVAVLIDRTHKSFPIKVDYVGLSLATTLKENIDVQLKKKGDFWVELG